ncbi:hypothetical protein BH11ARM1_BH11ARM1_01900 [soil metagenome]
MDRILPIDLERAQLRKSALGYAKKEVDTLIKGATESLQMALVENDRIKAELDQARSEVGRARTQEDTLKDTLVMAQKAADETRLAAQRSAEAIINEARNSANSQRLELEQALVDLKWEIEKLKMERDRFRDDFRSVLDRYQRDMVAETLTVVALSS